MDKVMDTSEQYIKMCDCPEIQEHRKYDGGDWLCNPEDGHSWAIWQKVHGKSDENIRKFMDGLLWLPRQDQIQEMIEFEDIHHLVYGLKEFSRTFYGLKKLGPASDMFESMEQLWLAFYMWETHSKTWDGTKWIKSETE